MTYTKKDMKLKYVQNVAKHYQEKNNWKSMRKIVTLKL